MAKEKNEAGEFPGLLALMRRGIDFGNLFVDTAASLCDETQNDRISAVGSPARATAVC
ncbi:MAG: hypothetical protein ACLTTP_10750 [Alistipes ihumii]